jgi:SOUL heme-binding protein
MAIETPHYQVLRKDGDFELRRYDGYLAASVHVDGSSASEAVNSGFNVLADFIFGNNRSAAKIAMTAPVSAEPDAGEHIAMTAPVGVSPEAEAECVSMACAVDPADASKGYRVTFTMPSKYTLESLPVPNDGRVEIESVSAYTAAVVTFSGYANESNRAKAQAKLEGWIAENGLHPVAAPILAQYNPPWTPWFARRNEIIVPVAEAAAD